MRIGIGAVVGIVGGPATYATSLIEALGAIGGHEYVVFTDRPDVFAAVNVETVHVPLRRALDQLLWDHLRMPGEVRRARVDLYHGTKGILPWRLPVPGVVTVHDLAVYAMPETFAWQQRLHLRAFVPASVRRATAIVTVSEHARGDLIRILGVDPARVTVIPNGVREALRRPADGEASATFRRAHGLGERVIACVGTLQPRKRVERVVEAFRMARLAEADWQLAIAGRRRPGYVPDWIDALPPGVVLLGEVDEDELRALYAAASIAVSASEYEGFGLTVAEAMASGCAVVAVGVTSIPEVVGDAGMLLPGAEAGMLADAMTALAADEGRRRALGAAARRRAERFTWDAAARATREVYERVLG